MDIIHLQAPLSHTLEDTVSYIKINGELASEFLINTYTATYVNVPVVFVSGDVQLCKHAETINPHIKTVELNKGVGDTVICLHPQVANERIREGVEYALKAPFTKCLIPLLSIFDIEISFNSHAKAYKASFYPGMRKITSNTLKFETKDYFEVLRMLSFVV